MALNNIFQSKRNIDIVFCIDGTGSMAPYIDNIRENARRFHTDFVSTATDMGSAIGSMRVKVIVFRNYGADGNDAMSESRFFELPECSGDFEKFLADVTACGGSDAPRNGLEALYYAMKSDFTTGAKDRQVIALFTDGDALDLKEREDADGYPDDMVDMDGLIAMWGCKTQDASLKLRERLERLVVFAPDNTKYKELTEKLVHSAFITVNKENGLKEVDFQQIIQIIAASASN